MGLRSAVKSDRGMAIIFAVLLITIVFVVSLALFNITLKQIILSLVARDSRLAFYAADSALNCARYWDWDKHRSQDQKWQDPKNKPFGFFELVSGKYVFQLPPANSVFDCNGDNAKNVVRKVSGDDYIVSFSLFFPTLNQVYTPCANVVVTKDSSLNVPNGSFVVSGYNTSDPNSEKCPLLLNQRTVERGIQSSY